jgi:hypothetical protein
LFVPLRLTSQSTPFVTGADKPQVSALKKNRGKFVKKPSDSIRRKFSIDAILAIVTTAIGASTISKPYRLGSGNLGFTIRAECPRRTAQIAHLRALFCGRRACLSVRLSSL